MPKRIEQVFGGLKRGGSWLDHDIVALVYRRSGPARTTFAFTKARASVGDELRIVTAGFRVIALIVDRIGVDPADVGGDLEIIEGVVTSDTRYPVG